MAAKIADLELADTVRSPTLRADTEVSASARDGAAAIARTSEIRDLRHAVRRQSGTQVIVPVVESGATESTLAQVTPLSSKRGSLPQVPPTESGGPQFELTVSLWLSAIAGYVDTAGVIALYGLFVAHVTGGLVSIGLALTEHSSRDLLARLAMVLVFIFAVAGTALFSLRKRRRGRKPLTSLLVLMTFALALFAVLGVLLEDRLKAHQGRGVFVVGATAVVAMAIQNTLMRSTLGGASPTTIMTGNLTQVIIDLIELSFPDTVASSRQRKRSRAEVRRRLAKSGLPLTGFVVGACAGAIVTHAVGFAGILLPTIAVAALALTSFKRESKDVPHRHASGR